MKRIFIDSDFVQEDEVRSCSRTLSYMFEENKIPFDKNKIFDEVVSFAWHEGDKAWEAVKNAEEIYADSSLVPLCGYGTYTGSVVVMDVMMQKAIDESITGKSIFFFREEDDIHWDGIDLKLLVKAFENNKLFCIDKLHDNFIAVDVKQIAKRYKA